ncbi:uncharacterized protein LOC113370389 [Ctenocephalides felis]|uniref:uncharacterized protein LOC113370389 n=1 Tax=Ctenocephalides felis TaxID=7515 RepID=UPI000E6E354A|nr:uncharacterized protein LOC113370389 [Ctenocephalides felis]
MDKFVTFFLLMALLACVLSLPEKRYSNAHSNGAAHLDEDTRSLAEIEASEKVQFDSGKRLNQGHSLNYAPDKKYEVVQMGSKTRGSMRHQIGRHTSGHQGGFYA